jgi:isopenicillin-N epimerase
MVDLVEGAITPRTKLAHLDHITSPTALVFPLARLVPLFGNRGIPVLVDGAHAAGQLPLAVDGIGATWYVGTNHKWVCGPKASGFLVTQTPMRPLVTSHGANPNHGPANRLHAELDWAGTYDAAAQLAVPTAIAAVGSEGGGWPAVYERNHALALALRDRLGGTVLAPADAIGTMAALPIELPAGVTPLALQKRLLADGWEVPIVDFPGRPLVRVSAHLYNTVEQADALAAKLHELGAKVC